MCGLFGVFSTNGLRGYTHRIREAHDRGSHRGPDDQGFIGVGRNAAGPFDIRVKSASLPEARELDACVALVGHHRLSIIDLSAAGHQPMPDTIGKRWIAFNGEVYNYIELRKELEVLGHRFRSDSDTEVVLQAYSEWGPDCVSRFIGMWAFAILDLAERVIFCSRDRFGIKPLFFCHNESEFAFASELKQLSALTSRRRFVNAQAVYEYLSHGTFDHSAQTFLNPLARLLPGENLIFNMDSTQLSVRRYYDPVLQINFGLSPSEAGERLRDLLTDSVRLQLRSDVEVGSCLSGGIDSSSIVCIANRLLRLTGVERNQRTFSAIFDEPEANEKSYADIVVAQTGVDFHEVRPSADGLLSDLDNLILQQDEPFGSTSIYAQWCVYKAARDAGVKVMLDGQGADEQLAGYVGLFATYFHELKSKGMHLSAFREKMWYAARHRPSFSAMIGLISPRVAGFLTGRVAIGPQEWLSPGFSRRHRDEDSYISNLSKTPFGKTEALNNLLYQLTFVNNLPTLLRYADRNSMAFSVESRVPFVDHRLVEFSFSLSSQMKIHRGFTKNVLRDAMAGILPEAIRLRVGKLGFATPERKWQLTALRSHLASALGSDRLKAYVDVDAATNYLLHSQRTGEADFVPWRWINLHRWLELNDV